MELEVRLGFDVSHQKVTDLKKKGKTQDKGWNQFFTMGWNNKSGLLCVSVYIKDLLGFMLSHT